MAESGSLRIADLRAVYRLLGDCRELGREPRAWSLHMLEGLRRLTGAQVALYLHLHDLGTEAERVSEPLDVGFLGAPERALWARYQRERAYRDDPFHQQYYRDFAGPQRTRRLRSVVDLGAWHRSRHDNEYVRACRLGDRITSSLRLATPPSPTVQTIVLHRAAADGEYPERAVRLVRFFHEELRPLLGRQLQVPGPGAPPGLPSQLGKVLFRLLRGDAEKEIAARLGLSRHTVNRHVQRLYRRFGVHGRVELLFRCRHLLTSCEGGGAPTGAAAPPAADGP